MGPWNLNRYLNYSIAMSLKIFSTYFLQTLPLSLQQNRGLLFFAAGAFLLPLVVSFILVHIDRSLVLVFYGEFQLAELSHAYRPDVVEMRQSLSSHHARDALFYFANNALVGLQLFLAGSLFGLGTCLLLIYGAVSLGMLMGYIQFIGYGATLWPAIISHSVIEILATLLAAVAGFKLGLCLLACIKSASLKGQGLTLKQMGHLLAVSVTLYALAALIESAWSHNLQLTAETRYMGGALLWISVLSYVYFALVHAPRAADRHA